MINWFQKKNKIIQYSKNTIFKELTFRMEKKSLKLKKLNKKMY